MGKLGKGKGILVVWFASSTGINNGISERLFGKHGRWKSGYSRDRYLKDSKSKRLSVSLALGL